jgi:hypothetical protein
MAKATIKPDKEYRVKLSRPVEIAPGVWARPGDEVKVLGHIVSALASEEKIANFEET